MALPVPDHRKHRGPDPEDRRLFGADALSGLRAGVGDLSWLLSRGYASPSAIKIVGDRYGLEARQRVAVARCACGEEAMAARQGCELAAEDLAGRAVWIDGYNVLTSVEAALAGGVILAARDGCYRDMASMHGTYRSVEETAPAIRLVGEVLTACGVGRCRWLLDRPVSNSGRLKGMLLEVAAERGWPWDAELVADPDPLLGSAGAIVATADSHVLDAEAAAGGRWVNLARQVIEERVAGAWVLDLSG